MTAALLGQMTTMLIIAAVLLYAGYKLQRPVFVRLRLRRTLRQWRKSRYLAAWDEALEINRVLDRVYRHRDMVRAVQSDLGQGTEFQQRARKAEGLGFLDETDTQSRFSA